MAHVISLFVTQDCGRVRAAAEGPIFLYRQTVRAVERVHVEISEKQG
jgi:hypothetical protein